MAEADPPSLDNLHLKKTEGKFQHQNGKPRQHGLDNLRSFLTALMVIHHTAIAYGGIGYWYFESCYFPAFSPVLSAFNAINQTFFMGMFFFLSGLFTRRSLSERPHLWKTMIRSRLLRLGLPTLLYTVFVEPASHALVAFSQASSVDLDVNGIIGALWDYWSRLGGVRGPVWYLAVVTIFDLVAVVFSPSSGNRLSPNQSSDTRSWMIPSTWMASILASFIVRIPYPINRIYTPLSLRLAFLPQYILAYCWGYASAPFNDPLIFAPVRPSMRPLRDLLLAIGLSIVGIFLLFGMSIHLSGSLPTALEMVVGGINLPALLYAIWNELSFALIAPPLIRTFEKHVNYPIYLQRLGGCQTTSVKVLVARYSYAAFLAHAPISLGLELIVEGFTGCLPKYSHTTTYSLAGPVLMTVAVGLANVLLSWFAAWLLVTFVPGVGKII